MNYRGSFDPAGYTEEKVVGMDNLKMVDPFPTTYAVVEFDPREGAIEIEIAGAASADEAPRG